MCDINGYFQQPDSEVNIHLKKLNDEFQKNECAINAKNNEIKKLQKDILILQNLYAKVCLDAQSL